MSKATTVKSIISDYTIDTGFKTFTIDATSGNITVTLPLISNLDGINFKISRVDTSTNTVTLDGNGANINGTSTQQFFPNSNAQVTSVNGDWNVTNGSLLPVIPLPTSVNSYRFFTMMANQTVSNTTTETSLFSNSLSNVGSLTFNPTGGPSIIAGRIVRFSLMGLFSRTNGGNVTINLKLNSNVVATSIVSYNVTSLGFTNAHFSIDGYVIFRTVGNTGSVMGDFHMNGLSGAPTFVVFIAGSTATTAFSPIDTTSPLTLDVTVTFATANATNSTVTKIGNCYLE